MFNLVYVTDWLCTRQLQRRLNKKSTCLMMPLV